MTRLLMLLNLFFCSAALAHDVDRICEAGQTKNCQLPISRLGLDIPEFADEHRHYWHCRRELVTHDIVPYAKCVGAVNALERKLGWSESVGEPGLLNYWAVIPAHPELDEPGNPEIPQQQTRDCEATRAIAWIHNFYCSLYLRGLEGATR